MILNYYKTYTQTLKILYILFNSKTCVLFSLDEILENIFLYFYSVTRLSEIINTKK